MRGAAATGGSGRNAPWSREWIVRTLTVVLLTASVTAIASFFWPRSYRAEAKILPNQSASVGSSLASSAAASGLGDLIPGQMGGRENPILTYPEILSSRSLLERVTLSPYPADTSNVTGSIMQALGIKGASRQSVEKGVRKLGSVTRVETNLRSGLVYVSAVTRDSVLSAQIVQRMLLELDHFNVDTRASQGRATREFLEGRIKEARLELREAEEALASFRQTNVRISNSAQLQLEQARFEREVDTRSELYRMLAREFEAAKIEEKRDTPTFTVVDPARPPVRKYRPRILFNVAVSIFAALGLRLLLQQIHLRTFFRFDETKTS